MSKKIIGQKYFTSGIRLNYRVFENVRFKGNITGIDFFGCSFKNCSFKDVVFEDCNFTHTSWNNVNIEGTYFKQCDFECVRGIMQFGPIGHSRRIGYTTKFKNKVYVQLGCFWGTEKKALEAISCRYNGTEPECSDYLDLVKLSCRILKNQGIS